LNILLSLNKKLFLIFLILVFFIILGLISFVYLKSNSYVKDLVIIDEHNADIIKPKFAINSNKQKIIVTANQGNFLTDEKIILEDNVIFKSSKFKIYTNNVLFNKKNLVASSQEQSRFVSKNAVINSTGFDIIEKGNIINFKGQTTLTLK
jgi:hypothetical protein